MKNNNRLLAVLLIAACLTALLCVNAFAAETTDTWNIGSSAEDSITAHVEGDTLYITGKGAPKSFSSVPWKNAVTNIKKAVVSDGITCISAGMFFRHTNLSEVTLPDSVEKIDTNAFYCCYALKALDFPDKLTTIGSKAFFASGIESIALPDTTVSIGAEAFRDCGSLKSISLPNGLEKINRLVFAGCSSVAEIHLPASLTSVDYGVFHSFGASVIDVYYDGSAEEFKGINMVRSHNESGVIYYNDCLDKAYYHFTISTRDDLLYFLGSIANGDTHEGDEYTLTNNISLGDFELTRVWSDANREKPFKGHFNGGGYTVSDFRITTDSYRGGFFRTLGSGAVIENLTLKNGNLKATGAYSAYGLLVGLADGNVTITNCHTKGHSFVVGDSNVGGLIGETKSGTAKITDCSNDAYAFANGKDAGGILAHNTSDGSITITGCKNTALVYANQSYAGGIAGYLGNDSKDQAHTVTDCKNSGEVSSELGVCGGIVGGLCTDSLKHVVTDNVNTGRIKAQKNAGGIIGFLEGGGVLERNRNEGKITSDAENVGGIVAATEDDASTFHSCSNAGELKAARRCGGIIGYAGDNDHDKQLIFTDCHNTGTVTGGTDAGGIAGGICTDNRDHRFTNCDNSNKVEGKECVGGIIGWMEGGGQFTGLTNTGVVITGYDGYVGGIIGRIEDDPTTFTDCANRGTLVSGAHRGNICGYDGKTKKAIGSVFGTGRLLYIAAFSLIVIAVLAIVFLIVRKKRRSAKA